MYKRCCSVVVRKNKKDLTINQLGLYEVGVAGFELWCFFLHKIVNYSTDKSVYKGFLVNFVKITLLLFTLFYVKMLFSCCSLINITL